MGLWIGLKLHKYLELDRDMIQALPYLFSGLGVFILILSSAACGCSIKGTAPKIYIVRVKLFQRECVVCLQ